MPRFSPGSAWSAGEVLTSRTLFQVHEGLAQIETKVVPTDVNQGVRLSKDAGLELPAGLTVYFRRRGSSACVINRTELE
jgi:hypothetical protein